MATHTVHADGEMEEEAIDFVQWSRWRLREGRVVRLDDKSRIIYNIPWAVAIRVFAVVRVAVAKVPVAMVKAKRHCVLIWFLGHWSFGAGGR